MPPTLLHQQRMARRAAGGDRLGAAAEEGARSLAQGLRERLLGLRDRLLGLQSGVGRFQRRAVIAQRLAQRAPRPAQHPVLSSPTRSSEERAISLLAVLAAVALSLGIAAQPRRGSADLHTPDMQTRITAMAEAIAVAEGFYAPGRHNGHSLPHALNNPGALKKPTLNAAGLATWKDTGLVIFPDAQAGWAALRHQIALMLSGKSGIYTPSDNLLEVARKYAEGDLNWGRNVAGELGVPPHTTLAELGPGASRLGMVILPRLRAGLMARLGEGARQFRTWMMRPNRATTEVACSVP